MNNGTQSSNNVRSNWSNADPNQKKAYALQKLSVIVKKTSTRMNHYGNSPDRNYSRVISYQYWQWGETYAKFVILAPSIQTNTRSMQQMELVTTNSKQQSLTR